MDLLNPNLSTLEATAKALEPILEDLAFVGVTIDELIIYNSGAGSAKPTGTWTWSLRSQEPKATYGRRR